MQSVAAAIQRLDAIADSTPVARLAEAFSAAGHELALVGGSVRDAFLGRSSGDLDFTTDARPDDILAIVAPLADAVWDVGRDFGTIAARVHGQSVEITTYRADSYDGTTRKPSVEFGDSLEADLERRDFTVNAMALALPARKLVDPWGGVEHLLEGTIATPGAPEISFGDDPLRMMRAARFTSQLGFTVAPDTQRAMAELAPRIEIVSVERVSDELSKLMLTDDPVPGIRLLVDTGLAQLVLPEVPALRLERDEHAHHKDVYEHTLTVVRQAIELEKARPGIESPDLVLRWAALLHDIGKPATRRIESGGVVTFHHHDVVGAKLASKRLKALRMPSDTISSVARLVELHLRFFGYTDGAWTDSAVRRYVRDAGDQLERLHILTRADVTTRNVRKADRLSFAYDDLEERIAAIQEAEGIAAVRPDLNGDEIMRILGLTPGREVGEAYKFLLDLRLDEGPLGPDEAERRLVEWYRTRGN
ncbi:poly(A) polymerase [Microbacteriaceae bacterium SG_E_30_P1]|uniref:Poly(A) polymerase n=1 Tax=Antiquaquibacter oligotrophicus TaxID=2880260 RepID=A0ABT6KSA1_9MICO|nr:CCA tRNA nucleotidyltransferase [Antiquaquibacter oligotrophicus]MDH6182378.1 poly(A) polymerase [Antiquaquibacter oligotrophicus]UDF14648.1 CCA tRNA nucleotidyltransferase [Antiquaquibacter oligotrophicus]